MSLTITVPAPCAWLNSNDRRHRMAHAALVKLWRSAAREAAKELPALSWPVDVTAHVWKPRGGRYDPGNLYPTAKACLDGIVDAGLLPDDDHKHVTGPDMRHGGKGPAALVITINT